MVTPHTSSSGPVRSVLRLQPSYLPRRSPPTQHSAGHFLSGSGSALGPPGLCMHGDPGSFALFRLQQRPHPACSILISYRTQSDQEGFPRGPLYGEAPCRVIRNSSPDHPRKRAENLICFQPFSGIRGMNIDWWRDGVVLFPPPLPAAITATTIAVAAPISDGSSLYCWGNILVCQEFKSPET